jgi:hypothetical protein
MLFRFGRQVRSNPATDIPNSLSLFPENGVTEMVRRLIVHLGVVDLVGRLLWEDHRYADSFGWH